MAVAPTHLAVDPVQSCDDGICSPGTARGNSSACAATVHPSVYSVSEIQRITSNAHLENLLYFDSLDVFSEVPLQIAIFFRGHLGS